jgi:predicted dehydrogenase
MQTPAWRPGLNEELNMTIGIGILGFAHGHVGTYCDVWSKLPASEVRVVAGWDHDAARATQNQEKFKFDIEPTSAALLDRKDITAVVIGAETSLHADLCVQAAAAGKDIVLQKPMALTLAEADRIVAAVKKAGVRFTLAWQMRVDPQNIKMKELIHGGALGRVVMFRRRHGLGTHTWAGFENSWHASRAFNRGMWADDAAHPIDLLLWLFGEPRSVTAEIATLINPKVPDDNGVAIFRYDDGLIAEVMCSFTSVAGENSTEITAENATVIQNFGDAVSCNAPRTAGATGLKWIAQGDPAWTDSGIASPAGHGVRIAALALPILEFLQGKREPIATAEEGRTALKMVLASYAAAELGRRVSVPDFV